MSLAKLKMEGLRSGRGGGGADRVSALGIEDIVHMETDVLQVLRTACVVLLQRRSARLLLPCLWRKLTVFRVLQEKFVRFVRMAGLMAYGLEEERNLELPASGAWSLVRNRELAAKKPRVFVCFVVSVVCVTLPSLRLWRFIVAGCAFCASCTYYSTYASEGRLFVLRVVHTAAWDWEPPHMSGYPHLPPPRHHSIVPSCPLSIPALVPPTPAVAPLYAAAAPPPPCATRRPPPPSSSALWRAPLRNVQAAGASTEV